MISYHPPLKKATQHKAANTSTLHLDDALPATMLYSELKEPLNQSDQVQSQLRLQQSLNESPQLVRQAKLAQTLSAGKSSLQPQQLIQRREQPQNKTGLPDQLKAGMENLSGIAMDDVKVHYNSMQPARVQALAYTQGTDIHVGPGQERYLAHEAWHAVQQKQGRVQPTVQTKNLAINDDAALEHEADVMGARAEYTGQSEETRQLVADRSTFEDDDKTAKQSGRRSGARQRAAAQSHLAATLSLRTLQPQSANNSVLQAEWIELGSPDLVVWNEILDGVTWYADAQGLMWFEISNPREIRLGTLDAYNKLAGPTHKRSYESWDELEQIEAPDIEQRFEEITSPGRESPEEEIKEQLVSTKHIYAPLTADASLETYNKTVEDLKGSRKSLATAAEKISGEENKLVFTTAIDLITVLQKLKKVEGTEWKGVIATLNTAGAAYVKAILIIQKNEPKTEQAEETTTAKAIGAIQDQTLLQMMATDQLLADPIIRSRIENEGGGSFGWTNAKGEVGEFYGKQTLEELGREKTRKSGGNFKIINVVVTSNESGPNPTRIKEIDGLEVEISGKKYILIGIYEIKTTTEGKSNLTGELTTSLAAKSKALRDAEKKGNRIWTKEGEVLKEDITNMLIVPPIDKLTIQTVGPVRSGQAPYNVVFNKNINKITDQIACLWLQQHPLKTIENIQLGTGRASAFTQFKS